MTEKTRNLAVGATVIIALTMLGILILLFTGLPGILKSGYTVRMQFDAAHDIAEGDNVHMADIRVGMVTSIDFADPADPTKGVIMKALISRSIHIPKYSKAVIYTKGFVGKGYLEIVPKGERAVNPTTGEVLYYPTDGTAMLAGENQGNGLFPPEMTEALKQLSSLAKNLNEMVAPTAAAKGAATTTSATSSAPAEGGGLQGTIVRLNRTLDALYVVMGDQQNQANIKTSLANLSVATAKVSETMDSFKEFAQQAQEAAKNVSTAANTTSQQMDALARKLMDDADAISKLMKTIDEAVRKLSEGQGTTGKLINDPKLYNNLVDATRQLNDLVVEFRELFHHSVHGG